MMFLLGFASGLHVKKYIPFPTRNAFVVVLSQGPRQKLTIPLAVIEDIEVVKHGKYEKVRKDNEVFGSSCSVLVQHIQPCAS